MDEVTNIEFLDPQAAREYVLAFILTLKRTRKEKEKLTEERYLWEKRVKLAGEKDEAALKSAAENRVLELTTQIEVLQREERDLENKVAVLKANLHKLKEQSTRSVDTDALLSQLELLVGERDTLEEKFKDEEAQSALEELKRKMKGQ